MPDAMPTPRIAVFGCGGWGRNIVRSMAGLKALAAVADLAPANRAKAAELAPGVPVHESVDAILEDDAIHGVMIATPAETHYDLARRAIAAGKHVFVEKPLTIDVAESRDLVQRAENAGVVLMVGHLLEYHPAVLKLCDLIAAGELGQVRYIISNRTNLGKIRVRENALWSFAPHDIAVILRIMQVNPAGRADPVQVVATGGAYISPTIADVTVTQLLFADGARAHVFVSWLHPFKEQRLVVIGSKKMASFCDITKELVLHDQRVDWKDGEPVPVKGDGTPVPFDAAQPLDAECRHFIDCVAHARRPRTDGQNGVRVLEILHAAQRSMAMNGAPVNLDRLDASATEGLPIIVSRDTAPARGRRAHAPVPITRSPHAPFNER